MSDNEALDNPDCTNAYWQTPKKREDLAHIKNSQNEELGIDALRAGFQTGEDGLHQLNSQRRDMDQAIQVVSYDAWIPNWERPNSRQQDPIPEADGDRAESRGTLRRSQKLGRSKKGSQSRSEEGRSTYQNTDSMYPDDMAVASCMGLPKKTDKRPNTPQQAQENSAPTPTPAPGLWNLAGAPPNRQRWSTSGECPPPWGAAPYHTCRRPLSEYRAYTCDFTLPRGKEWDRPESAPHMDEFRREPSPHCARSVTDMDLCDPNNRSSSFGRFEAFRQNSTAKPEENGVLPVTDGETGTESGDQHKPGGLGKKMRAISMTMRRKMGKKHPKASFSEEQGEDDTDRDHEGEAESGHAVEKEPTKNSNSQESLYSGLSSSSGVTSGSDGSSTRDSLRLEEDVPYTGQFCGRCRVHTDFVPSPYDTDSLKLKVGDVIDIISKPPMGIWTGMLNNKVGNFKFIYVDVIIEKEAEAPKIRPHRRSRQPRPNTLQELLESLNLQEYASSLLLNGYQTVEDLKDLKEKDLIELNVWNPEHRHLLLVAAESLQDAENENETENEDSTECKSSSGSLKLDQNDCPRDSGCYVTPESSENCKEEGESQPGSPDP